MNDLEQIEYVLCNFFAIDHGFTREESARDLAEQMTNNPVYASKLRAEVDQSFKQGAFDWKGALERTNAGYFTDDAAARMFAAESFGPPLGLRAADLIRRLS